MHFVFIFICFFFHLFLLTVFPFISLYQQFLHHSTPFHQSIHHHFINHFPTTSSLHHFINNFVIIPHHSINYFTIIPSIISPLFHQSFYHHSINNLPPFHTTNKFATTPLILPLL